jgi:hypothetical protein
VGLVKIEGETPFDGRELEEYRIGEGPPLLEPTVDSRPLTVLPGRSTGEPAIRNREKEQEPEARKPETDVRESARSHETPAAESRSSHVEPLAVREPVHAATPAQKEPERRGIEGGLGGSPEGHFPEIHSEK